MLIVTTTSEAATASHHKQHSAKLVHCRKAKRGHRHHRCVASHKPKRASPTVNADMPHTTAISPTPTVESSATPPAPTHLECATNSPIPSHIEGQTSIVGYAIDNGGPAPPPGAEACPHLSSGDMVLLENTSREVLQSQALNPGQPFDFLVEPGEYYVVDGACPAQQEGPMFSPLVVRAGQQKHEDVGCNQA